MNGNKQTGLTHLHVYTFVIYRMERGTVACILITACRSLRKIHGNSSHAFHELYGGIKDGRLHENLTIQSQPSESHPRNREKEGANSSIGASPLHIIKRFFSITERLYEYFAKKLHLLLSV